MIRARPAAGGGEPGYVRLHRSGELQRRVDAGRRALAACRCCPWRCGVDRLAGETQVCRTGRWARVYSYFPHGGEEDCLRGRHGSGTLFFAWCNLRCVFCQNAEISNPQPVRRPGEEPGREATPEDLARMMLELQAAGCHNINWVTPEHVVPQVLEAMPLAVEGGLRLPIVYNTSAYDEPATLRLLDGIVDIYMPDFKYWSREACRRYLKCPDYAARARAAIREMHRQVGDLVLDAHGLARRGLLVRHLVMPGGGEDTRRILRFLAREISPDTYLNLMDQYHPAGAVAAHPEKYPALARRITPAEYAAARAAAREVGLHRLDPRRPVP